MCCWPAFERILGDCVLLFMTSAPVQESQSTTFWALFFILVNIYAAYHAARGCVRLAFGFRMRAVFEIAPQVSQVHLSYPTPVLIVNGRMRRHLCYACKCSVRKRMAGRMPHPRGRWRCSQQSCRSTRTTSFESKILSSLGVRLGQQWQVKIHGTGLDRVYSIY